jgi:acetyl/propionyl-CoA carboxylase alpha subunit
MSRRLHLKLGGALLPLAYERRGGRIALDFGARRFEADVTREGLWFHVRSGEREARCAVARGRRGIWVSCEGRSFLLEEERADAGSKDTAGTDELRAPMTGRVVQVAARPGQSVRDGDLLVTIEAMKMEFRLTAPEDATVADVRCEAGARVELGDLLVVLEPRP